MNENRLWQRVSGTSEFHRIEKIVHFATMVMLMQVAKHVEHPAIHGTKSLHKEVQVGGLVPKIEIPRVPIIGDALALQPIPQLLELSTSDLVLRLPLHFAINCLSFKNSFANTHTSFQMK